MTKPTVLIVEDEAPLVTMLRYNLEKEGFDVCEAGDGEEALMQIAERKPDIVLLDWMLPRQSVLLRAAMPTSADSSTRARQRRSLDPPWSRRRRAQPIRTTSRPMSLALRSPQ